MSWLVTVFGSLAGVVLILTPGYVLSQTYHRGVRGPQPSDTRFVASAAIGGIAIHFLALPWTISLIQSLADNPLEFLAASYLLVGWWAVVVLIVAPAVMGAGIRQAASLTRPRVAVRVLHWLGLTAGFRTAEAWTWLFRTLDEDADGHWLRVKLRERTHRIVGAFGPNSFASSDPNLRDLLLETTWPVDEVGVPLEDGEPGGAVWIRGDEIETIEVFGPGQEENGA